MTPEEMRREADAWVDQAQSGDPFQQRDASIRAMQWATCAELAERLDRMNELLEKIAHPILVVEDDGKIE